MERLNLECPTDELGKKRGCRWQSVRERSAAQKDPNTCILVNLPVLEN